MGGIQVEVDVEAELCKKQRVISAFNQVEGEVEAELGNNKNNDDAFST